MNTPTVNYAGFVARQTDNTVKQASKIANADTPRVNQRRMLPLHNLRYALTLYRRRLGQHQEIDLIFSDECRSDQSKIQATLRRWNPTNTRLYARYRTQVHGPSVNCIAFRSVHLASCEYFDDHNLTGQEYAATVEDVLQWKRQNGVEHVLLVLDNASVHSRPRLVALQQTYPFFMFCFLPVYSPELNICEFFFSALKSKIRQKMFSAPTRTVAHWQREIQRYADSVTFSSRVALDHVQEICNAMIRYNGSLALAMDNYSQLKNTTRRRRYTNKAQRYRR